MFFRLFSSCFSSVFCSGGALASTGDALQQVAQARDAMDVNVKRTFIDPLQELHDTKLKEIRVRGCTPLSLHVKRGKFVFLRSR